MGQVRNGFCININNYQNASPAEELSWSRMRKSSFRKLLISICALNAKIRRIKREKLVTC